MTTVQSDAPSQVLFCGGELSAVAHPSIQKKILGSAKTCGTATHPTQVGDKRHAGSLCGPIHEGKLSPRGSWSRCADVHPSTPTPYSPKASGRLFLTGLTLP